MSSARVQNTVSATESNTIIVNSSVHVYLAMLNLIITKQKTFIETAGYLRLFMANIWAVFLSLELLS